MKKTFLALFLRNAILVKDFFQPMYKAQSSNPIVIFC